MIKRNNKPFAYAISFFLITGLLVSCSVERKLASEFYRSRDNNAVLFIPADFLYKQNLKTYQVYDMQGQDQYLIDSALYYRSDFVQFVSDSIFLETYNNTLIASLRDKGLKVYLQPDTDLFMQESRSKYIINMAQLLLEEEVEQLFDPYDDVEYYYVGDFYLNKVTLNAWFEISGINKAEPSTNVAFADLTLNDSFDGRLRFFPFTGEFAYTYSVDSIQVDDLYYMADLAGQRFAGFIFDYILNRYVDNKLPANTARRSYFRYDTQTRMVKPANEDRFIIIE
jgi:hypothetical protein